ncbi:MAG: hypothetical protein ACXV97_06525, partial [Chthoniobacterales bacterium]
LRLLALVCCATTANAQSIAIPWSGHGHDPQHTGISKVASQPMAQIKWQMLVDLNRQYIAGDLLIHYGAPLITRQNTIIVPVKTGAASGFRVEARDAADGTVKWMQNSDYTMPPHDWIPPFGIALTPKNRVYFPGNGGTVYFRDSPDAASGTSGQLAFYGIANYQANPASFNQNVIINTPITPDRYGNIYFGFQADGGTNPSLNGGIARIAEDGTGSWMSASSIADDGTITGIADNCAPALSNDQKTLYFAVTGTGGISYLVSVDSRTLAPIAKVQLKDVAKPGNDASLSIDSSATPTIGPDGDVYFGILENPLFIHNDRGWLLHYDASLTQRKTPGSFGWDDTVSIVPASAVPSYHGSSDYLLLSKYNNYAGLGSGNGVNKLAILDPHDTQADPIISTVTVMKEILTVTSPTPDDEFRPQFPNAVREWCINTAVIDPATKSAVVSCEDGSTYRWDFTSNTLSEIVSLTNGEGEAYTPTMIGVDGTVYAIANGILFAIGGAP